MTFNLRARVVTEFLGTAFLVAAVIGSGIMGERLAGGNVAIALLANTIATGAVLVALILTFSPISGAHLNPVVTLADAVERGIPWKEVPAYIAAQCAGGLQVRLIHSAPCVRPRRNNSTSVSIRCGGRANKLRMSSLQSVRACHDIAEDIVV